MATIGRPGRLPSAGQRCLGAVVIHRPLDMNQFEFVIVSGMRTAQLMRGCTPRVVQSLKPIVVTWKAAGLPKVRPALADLVRLQEPANGSKGVRS